MVLKPARVRGTIRTRGGSESFAKTGRKILAGIKSALKSNVRHGQRDVFLELAGGEVQPALNEIFHRADVDEFTAIFAERRDAHAAAVSHLLQRPRLWLRLKLFSDKSRKNNSTVLLREVRLGFCSVCCSVSAIRIPSRSWLSSVIMRDSTCGSFQFTISPTNPRNALARAGEEFQTAFSLCRNLRVNSDLSSGVRATQRGQRQS